MTTHTEPVVQALEAVVDVSCVWPHGLLHPGGPHRRLAGMFVPISIGEDECLVFGRLIQAFRPRHAFIIGNAFGFSSCYIAAAMQTGGGERVITLDSETEGDGQRCAKVARALATHMNLSILVNKKGFSPVDIPQTVEKEVHDLIFIDGAHSHPQVTQDFEGMLPYSHARTLFVWHDYWFMGIPQSVEAAKERGFRCLWLPTSCEMVVGTRDPDTYAQLAATFPEGLENPKRPSFLRSYGLIAREYVRYQLSRRFAAGHPGRPAETRP